MPRRDIHIVLSVEEADFPRAIELITLSLFSGSPWLPGFLFQSLIKGFYLKLRDPE